MEDRSHVRWHCGDGVPGLLERLLWSKFMEPAPCRPPGLGGPGAGQGLAGLWKERGLQSLTDRVHSLALPLECDLDLLCLSP